MAGHDHDDHHHHHDDHARPRSDHDHGSELSEMQLRVRALETILTEKGYIDPAALDLIIEAYETKIGPHNGARIIAKAWADPALQAGAARGCQRGDRQIRPCQPRRRSSDRGREHAADPQHDRLHAVLLLPVGDARPAAGLVQGRALPLARGQRSARRARRFRRDAAGRHENPGLGFDRRDALHRAADAARRHRGLERGEARRTGDARFDDRHRLAKRPEEVA